MRTILSTRRDKFNLAVAAASVQSSEWLIAVLKDKTRNNGHIGMWFTVASIVFDGTDWVHCKHSLSFEKGGVTRWATLGEAKEEACKAIG